jgi:hypothetical protein
MVCELSLATHHLSTNKTFCVRCLTVILCYGVVYYVIINRVANYSPCPYLSVAREIHASQTFSNLTKFVEILATFVSPNKFIVKIDSMVYVIILIIYYKY